jgi:ATP/maltotriose-dependent transcriptional regulator MalT
MASPKIRVRFSVEGDEQAAKITALLEALGYEVVRDLDHGTAPNRLRWAITRLTQKALLTEREADVLALVLNGRSNGEIAKELQIRKATVKWHMHNIFTKTGTATREGLLRDALQLGNLAGRSRPGSEAPEDDIVIEDGVDDDDDDEEEE